jgi:ABC-type multidrug transport system permease subunit
MKALARELIWFFIAVILASPIAYFFGYVMGLEPEGAKMVIEEEVFQMEMFIIGGIIGFVCTYLMRVIIWAMAKFLIHEDA